MKWLIGIIFFATLGSCAKADECEPIGQGVEWYGVLTWSTSDPFHGSGGFFLKTDLKSPRMADYKTLYTGESVYRVRIKADSMAERLLKDQSLTNDLVDIRGRWRGIAGSFADESCGLPNTSGKFFEVAAVSDWGVVK